VSRSLRYRPADVSTRATRIEAIRRSRRHPRPTQFDYLHLRALVSGLRDAIAAVPGPLEDVLDVWCGSRPYEDLFPPGARYVGLDVEGNPYGVADVVSDTLLPFPDATFDVVACIESFQFIDDPGRAVREFGRVLRPGGSVILTVPFAFEYGALPEARYTEHQLRALFVDWDDVEVRENGGRVVAWTTLTASLVAGLEHRIAGGRLGPLHALFVPAYLSLNGVGLVLARLEARLAARRARLPMDLMVTARRPTRPIGRMPGI
jgi:SAM-dependent methyltransferase